MSGERQITIATVFVRLDGEGVYMLVPPLLLLLWVCKAPLPIVPADYGPD